MTSNFCLIIPLLQNNLGELDIAFICINYLKYLNPPSSTNSVTIEVTPFSGPTGLPLHHFALYPGGGSAPLSQMERERLERLGIPPPPGGPGAPGGPPPGHPHHPAHQAQLEAAERLALATDPMVSIFIRWKNV